VPSDATALSQRARNWAVGSDPGLLRLRMATRTTGALATALLVLFALTKATGQPLTVALLGALVTMVSARSVNEPDPRRQRITMALLPLPTMAYPPAMVPPDWLVTAPPLPRTTPVLLFVAGLPLSRPSFTNVTAPLALTPMVLP